MHLQVRYSSRGGRCALASGGTLEDSSDVFFPAVREWTGKYVKVSEDGVFTCVVCGTELFKTDQKFESGSGECLNSAQNTAAVQSSLYVGICLHKHDHGFSLIVKCCRTLSALHTFFLCLHLPFLPSSHPFLPFTPYTSCTE